MQQNKIISTQPEINKRYIRDKTNQLYSWISNFLIDNPQNSKLIRQKTKSILEEVAKSRPNPQTDSSKIDYTLIHNKACELNSYLESNFLKEEYNGVDYIMEEIKNVFQKVAFHQANSSKRKPNTIVSVQGA